MKYVPSFQRRLHRRLRQLVAFAALTGLGSSAFAACNTSSCQATISLLYVTDTSVYIQLSGSLSGLTNCTPEGGVYLTLPKSNNNYSALYALLLLAKAQGTALTIRTNDGSSGCTVAYITS